MELNINIQKIGKLDNIFGFYRFASQHTGTKNHALLESVAEGSRDMLFSFIGLSPEFMIKIAGKDVQIYDVASERGEKIKQICLSEVSNEPPVARPFEDDVPMEIPAIDILKKMFPISRAAMPELFPRKIFSGGLLGYIGYDAVAHYVGYKPSASVENMFPDVLMGLFTNVLAYSHTTQTLYEINNTLGSEQVSTEVSKVFEKYMEQNKGSGGGIVNPEVNVNEILMKTTAELCGFKSNTSKEQWKNIINKTKEHIFAGDIVQAVIARKEVQESDLHPLDVYQALKILSPSPYMFYLNFEGAHNGDIRLMGASPEALITKNQTHLETVPIAGTRRRGRTPEDESKMEYELLHSEKELAEHIMLVDLARNDLSRVSVPGSVDTYKLTELRKYTNIMHLISKVRSESYFDPFSILKSMFPAGTVSGAPKKRAMEIISQLETESRGPYAGCAGYISFTGDMDMAISIRTIFNKNKTYIAQAGAGIVADSNPDEEYLETENKMRAALASLTLASQLNGVDRNSPQKMVPKPSGVEGNVKTTTPKQGKKSKKVA